MKKIKLTRGKVALVDDADFDWLNQLKWYASEAKKNTFYAMRVNCYGGERVSIFMHRLIVGLTDRKILVDHKDGNGLNNQRQNLRSATPTQNCYNRRFYKAKKSSKYKGVYLDRPGGSWYSKIQINRVRKYLGMFKSEIDAAIAYNEAATKYHGEFARLNIVDNQNP